MQAVHQYQLNPNNAKQVGVGQRIQEKGAYKGTFIRAEAVVSEKGTQGIEFAFKSDMGQTADYLTIWTVNSEGKELYGRKVIDALMTCLALRGINAQQAMVKKYNHETRQEENVKAIVFPELMNKPIGLLLVREEYEKTNGGTDWKMTIVGCFETQQHLTPKEILERSGPGQLDKMVALLQDRPLKKRGGSGMQDHPAHRGNSGGGSGFDDMDDDSIPF